MIHSVAREYQKNKFRHENQPAKLHKICNYSITQLIIESELPFRNEIGSIYSFVII